MCEISIIEDRKREFEVLALQYMDSFYSAALRMTRNETEAEDLVQDAYLRAYRFFDKFEKGTNVMLVLSHACMAMKPVSVATYASSGSIPQHSEMRSRYMLVSVPPQTSPESDQISRGKSRRPASLARAKPLSMRRAAAG